MTHFRLSAITCDHHVGYAMTEYHFPAGFSLGDESDCQDCRLALWRLNGTALAFSHLSKQQRATLNAVHEAGHAVLHVAFGHTVNFAMVADDPDQPGVIGNVNFDAYSTALRVAASTWAGREAVLRQLDRWRALDDASLVDAAYAMRGDWALLADLGLGEAQLEAARLTAVESVVEHWPSIERVADGLLACGQLTGDEVAALAQIEVAA